MIKGFLSNIHPFGKLILTLFIASSVFFILFFISVLIAIPIFHLDIDFLKTIGPDINNVPDINIIKFFQITQSIALFIIPPFIIAWFIATGVMRFLGLLSWPKGSNIILCIFIILFGLPVINFMGELNAEMRFPGFMKGVENWMLEKEDEFGILTERLLYANNISTLFLNIFMIAIIPAIGEELLFRGVVQQIFISWFRNMHWGVFVAAFIFSAIHLQFYGFLPRLLLGLYLGYLFVWSGSLWLPIIAHFTNNCAAVIFYYLTEKNLVDKSIENYGAEENTYYAVMVSTGIITVLMFIIYRSEKQRLIHL